MKQINRSILLLKPKLINSIDSKLQLSSDLFIQEAGKELDQLKIAKDPEIIAQKLDFIDKYSSKDKKFILKKTTKAYYNCKITTKGFTSQQSDLQIDVSSIKENIKELIILDIKQSLTMINVQFTFQDDSNDEESIKKINEELKGLNVEFSILPYNIQLQLDIKRHFTKEEKQQYEQIQRKSKDVIQIEGKSQYTMKPQQFASQSGYEEEGILAPEKIDFSEYLNKTDAWKQPLDIENSSILGELKTKLCYRKNNGRENKKQFK